MRLRHLFAAALLLPALFVHAAAESCSCTAADGSCTASISCPGGCIVMCPSDGCTGYCSGEGGGGSTQEPSATPTPEEGSSVTAEMSPSKRITIKAVKANGQQIASELSRVSDREIEFTPRRASERFNFEFKNVELWDILNYLSDFGSLTIDGTDFEKLKKIRRAMAGNQRMSMCLHNAPVKDVTAYLSFLSGVPLSVTSGDGTSRVTASLKQVTLSEIIDGISARAGVRIATAADASAQAEQGGSAFLSIILPLVLALIAP